MHTLLLGGPILDHRAIKAVLVRFRCFNNEITLLLGQLELLPVNDRLNLTSPLKVQDEIVPFSASNFTVLL